MLAITVEKEKEKRKHGSIPQRNSIVHNTIRSEYTRITVLVVVFCTIEHILIVLQYIRGIRLVSGILNLIYIIVLYIIYSIIVALHNYITT